MLLAKKANRQEDKHEWYSLWGKFCTRSRPNKSNKLISINIWLLKIWLYLGNEIVNYCSSFENCRVYNCHTIRN